MLGKSDAHDKWKVHSAIFLLVLEREREVSEEQR
jgi:hypothetical protein